MAALYIIQKTKKRNKKSYCYKVINSRSKRVFAKCSTRKNAEKQKKILYAIIYRNK